MVIKNLTSAALVMLVLVFSVGCGDDDPAVLGNDGATLNNLNLSGALALFSNGDLTVIEDSKGKPFFAMKLYALSKGGDFAEVPVSFSGTPNGGTENYTLYALNERYSILSFFTRSESYIIDQATGEVHKSLYIGQPQYCAAGANDLYFNDLYAYNVEHINRSVKISNFLSADAQETETPGVGHFILDKNDNLYSWTTTSTVDVSYYGSGSQTKIVSCTGIFNDHQNKLNVVFADGSISSLQDGAISPEVSLKNANVDRSLFQAYTFSGQQKTLAISYGANNYVTLYDVATGQSKLNISMLDNGNFSLRYGSAIGKYLFLFGEASVGITLFRIDITDYSYIKMSYNNSAILWMKSLTALSDTELLAQSCEPSSTGDGSCTPRLIYFDMSGNVKTIVDGLNPHAEVIRLSDNQ